MSRPEKKQKGPSKKGLRNSSKSIPAFLVLPLSSAFPCVRVDVASR